MTTILKNKPYNDPYLKLVSGNVCVTETYQNGTSWYRVYSDGWCEQGGVANATYTGTVIKLLKPYKDLDYKGLVINNGVNTSATINTSFTVKTTSQAILSSGFSGAASVTWRAWGKIA